MMRVQLLRGITIAVLCAGLLAACGSSRPATTTQGGKSPAPDTHRVVIYASLPLHGPQKAESQAIVNGIKVELNIVDYHRGAYRIFLMVRNDADPRTGRFSPELTVQHAREAAQNPDTIAYIGDLNSGATELSLPILNQAGIVQITPGSGYPGLTNAVKDITAPGDPARFYPIRTSHTLLRLIPNDLVQASAALEKLKGTGCVRVAAAAFGGGTDATAFVSAVAQTATLYGMTYVPPPKKNQPGNNTKLYPAYVEAMVHAGVNCFVLAGRITPASVVLTKYIRADLPAGYIVGSNGFCTSKWLGAGSSALPQADDNFLYCTSPALPFSAYRGAKPLVADLKKLTGRRLTISDRYAVYGYQAAELVVQDAMTGLGAGEDNRSEVREALLGGGTRTSSVVGNFSFDPFGNVAPHRYGLYTFKNGKLVYSQTLNPTLFL
jgi:branched-chain amino acid transport system substrate-binding protein